MARKPIAKILRMVSKIMFKQKIEVALLSGPEALVEVAEAGVANDFQGSEAVRGTLFSSTYPHKFEAAELAPDDFLSLVILLLAYSAIDPNLIGTPVFRKYQDSVFKACNALGIDKDLITSISAIEGPLYEIFDGF